MYKYKIFYEIYDHQLHLREKTQDGWFFLDSKASKTRVLSFTWV